MVRSYEVELTEPDGWPTDREATEFQRLLPCTVPVGVTDSKWVCESIRKIDGVWYGVLIDNEKEQT